VSLEPFLTCREMADFLGDYFEGALPVDQKREFERHLSVCPPCIHYLESYKATVALAKQSCSDAAARGAPPADVPEALIQAILAARKRQG
jgi:anti-sigma factor RsiW